jgi:hypothetical protein
MNSLSIRIVVTASLIVACVIQPLVGVAFGQDCGDTQISQSMLCEGCGCCEIEEAGEQLCCCSHDSSDADTDTDRDEAAPVMVQIAGTCNCGVSAPPMDRSNDRQRNAELTKLRAVSKQLVEVLSVAQPQPMSFRSPGDSDVQYLTHFSQRFLCVWRI